jgi:ADP-ribose pyrophosphatase YjhB (NUDIX family)
VAALITLEGNVVCVRQKEGKSSYLLLPGGGVDYRETLEQALVREVREETGLEVVVGRPLFINDTIDPAGYRHLVNITFEATVTGGSLDAAEHDSAIVSVELVKPETLLELDLRPPIAGHLLNVLRGEHSELQYLGPVFTSDATFRGGIA